MHVLIMNKKKEERFLELICDLYTGEYSVEITLEGRFKNFDLLNSKRKWLINYNQKLGITWISYYRIWSVFEKDFEMNKHEIQSFMKDMLSKHFKVQETIFQLSRFENFS